MKTLVFVALFALSGVASAVDYQAGWTAPKFYAEVGNCRQAIVTPAIGAYLNKGAQKKLPEDQVRSEVISLLPIIEYSASAVCYCAVNELAKAQEYDKYLGSGDLSVRLSALTQYVSGATCGDKLKESMKSVQDKETIESMRLK